MQPRITCFSFVDKELARMVLNMMAFSDSSIGIIRKECVWELWRCHDFHKKSRPAVAVLTGMECLISQYRSLNPIVQPCVMRSVIQPTADPPGVFLRFVQAFWMRDTGGIAYTLKSFPKASGWASLGALNCSIDLIEGGNRWQKLWPDDTETLYDQMIESLNDISLYELNNEVFDMVELTVLNRVFIESYASLKGSILSTMEARLGGI